ncbi:MAG: outer membrane lipoprotein carrier protein LolA [Bdellovibrionales bacterium]|nr:outer membrane lipoprotein carrier protein LolA [Bdellovibrionales bacterium]
MGFKQYLGNFILIFLISFVSLWSCANSPEKAKVENVIPSQSVKSSSKKTDNPIDQIKTVIKKYKKSSSIKMLVEREIYSSYLDETKTSEGTLYFSKGRLRLEIEKPDKYLLLMAKNVIWIENHLGQDMGGVQVSKIAASKNLKQKNALLAFLFDDIKAWDKFKVIGSKQVNKLTAIRLKPLEGQDLSGVIEIEMLVDTKNQEIKKIVYSDDLDNKTIYAFSKINFKARVKEKLFTYTPPKGAEVTKF